MMTNLKTAMKLQNGEPLTADELLDLIRLTIANPELDSTTKTLMRNWVIAEQAGAIVIKVD